MDCCQLQKRESMVCRTYKAKDYCNIMSILTIFLVILFCAAFFYQFIIMQPEYKLRTLVFVIFTILAILVFWSYIATSCTEPGKVPFYYGLTKQNTSTPVQKYCVICHNFKPERSHHCSTCRKCVMNMDHHCPWVNNCIGFHNRKFFLQFIGYLAFGLLVVSIIGVIFLIRDFQKVMKTNLTDIHFALKLIITLFAITMFFILGSFFAFHFNMVLQNTTTLQGLIRKQNQQKKKQSQINGYYMRQKVQQNKIQEQQEPDYDVGRSQNFQQVFGDNCFYWFIPLYGNGPKGNGIYWPKQQTQQVTGRRQNNNYRPLRKY